MGASLGRAFVVSFNMAKSEYGCSSLRHRVNLITKGRISLRSTRMHETKSPV